MEKFNFVHKLILPPPAKKNEWWRPRGSGNARGKKKLCAPLQDIADMLNKVRRPHNNSDTSSGHGSVVTRSMSHRGSTQPVQPASTVDDKCTSCNYDLDGQRNDRLCAGCINGFPKCITCESELDGLESEIACPRCDRLLHSSCLKG